MAKNEPKPYVKQKRQSSELREELMADVDTIWKTFPGISKDRLFDMLEPLRDHPRRTELVIQQLFSLGLKTDHFLSPDASDFLVNDVPDEIRSKLNDAALDELKKDSIILKSSFPQCDPIYIYNRLFAMSNKPREPGRVHLLALELIENPKYPTLQDRIMKERQQARVQYLLNLTLDLKKFLFKFPDPFKEFTDETRTQTQSYQVHVTSFLKYAYPQIQPSFVKSVAKRHNYRLSSCIAALTEEMKNYGKCK